MDFSAEVKQSTGPPLPLAWSFCWEIRMIKCAFDFFPFFPVLMIKLSPCAHWVLNHWTIFLAIGFVWESLVCSSGWSGTRNISAWLLGLQVFPTMLKAKSSVFHPDPMIRLERRLGQWFLAEDYLGSPKDTGSVCEPWNLTPAFSVCRNEWYGTVVHSAQTLPSTKNRLVRDEGGKLQAREETMKEEREKERTAPPQGFWTDW